MDEDGTWPKWVTKALVGVVVIVAVAVATVATGGAGAGLAGFIAAGALKGAIIGATTGAGLGAVGGALKHRISTGSWKGSGKVALEGGATGFMTGAITGAITGGGRRGVQALRNTKVTTSSLPPKYKSMSSMSKIKDGRLAQRRFYNIRKKAYFDIDYDRLPRKGHSLIHGHRVNFSGIGKARSNPINNIWWRLRNIWN